MNFRKNSFFARSLVAALVLAISLTPACAAFTADEPVVDNSTVFQGVKANTGYVTRTTMSNGTVTLKLSDDFKIPDTPAPHWQLVDDQGRVYLLNRLVIKDNKYNQTLTVPAHVGRITKVQIWCSFAEVLLGESTLTCPTHSATR